MKTTVKHISDSRVKLTISLGEKELADAEQVALTKLAKTVKAPGFRKGNVPASVAAKHVDPNALVQQTADDALSKAVAEAFISKNLQALARPEVEVTKFVPKQELEFTAETDIVPKVTLGDYKKLGIKKEKASVDKTEVDDVIERMRSGMAGKTEAKRHAQNGDEAVIDFIGKKDGVAFEGGTAKDHALELGSNSFIPGFEEAIVGMSAGDKKDIELTFPENYHVAELAGADVVFETTLKKVNEKTLPELDDEFVKKSGASEDVKTVADLKADIERELLTQKEKEIDEKFKDDLVSKLIDVSTVPAPQVLIDEQMKSLEQDMSQNLMYRNITLENYLSAQGYKDKDDWLKKEVTPAAEKRVKAGLVLAELSRELNIDATDEEKEANVAQYKAQYANNPELVKRFDEPEIRRDLENRLLTEKTVDELVNFNK